MKEVKRSVLCIQFDDDPQKEILIIDDDQLEIGMYIDSSIEFTDEDTGKKMVLTLRSA